ncbi:unnamed protein product, partial [Timema podura]|nr:unnamed protein product [Timema podura]
MDALVEEAERQRERQEAMRLEKLPRTLHENQLDLHQVGEEYIDVERHNARHFAQILHALVPTLLTLRSSIEVDEALQEFSSKYCLGEEDLVSSGSWGGIGKEQKENDGGEVRIERDCKEDQAKRQEDQ